MFISSATDGYRQEDSAFLDDSNSYLPKLEANFCRDFSCCGLVLDDLHDLLQHYEDHHVKTEDEASLLAAPSVPALNPHANTARPNRPDLELLKRKAMIEMCGHLNADSALVESGDDAAFDLLSESQSKKRHWRSSMSSPSVSTREFFSSLSYSQTSTPESSMPTTPTLSSAHDFSLDVGLENPMLYGPPSSAEDWLYNQDGRLAIPQIKKVRQTQHQGYTTPEMMSPQVIDSPASNLVVVDKPYKCPVLGCDKAYKNQNGLKYHKAHGNCATTTHHHSYKSESGDITVHMMPQIENKPYRCEMCSKRYKNLNGLKYHKAHSHQQISMAQAQREVATGALW